MSSKARPQQRVLVIGLIVIGILFTAFFGMRAFHAVRKFNGHRPPPPGKVETDVELIRDWMTIPFISNMYRVPEKTLFDALDISPFSNHDKSLKDINQDYYPDADGYALDLVKKTILANQPPPTPAASRAPTTVPPLTAPVAP
jgi:hypothetical protein